MGENAVEMKYLAPQDDVGFLMVLCKHSVVCVRENGTPVFMKRLEMPPSCIWPYRIQPGPEGTCECVCVCVCVCACVRECTCTYTWYHSPPHHIPLLLSSVQVQYLVGLYNGNVLVFSNTHLMWSAMLIHPAVSLRTGDIGSDTSTVIVVVVFLLVVVHIVFIVLVLPLFTCPLA